MPCCWFDYAALTRPFAHVMRENGRMNARSWNHDKPSAVNLRWSWNGFLIVDILQIGCRLVNLARSCQHNPA